MSATVSSDGIYRGGLAQQVRDEPFAIGSFWLFLALDIALLRALVRAGLWLPPVVAYALLNLLGFFALPTAVLWLCCFVFARPLVGLARSTVLAGLPALVVVVGPLFSRGVAGFLV